MIDSTPLSPKARRWLRELDPAVRAHGSVSKSTKLAVVQEILNWCLQQGIAPVNSLQLPAFSFDLKMLDDIAALQQQLGEPLYKDDLSQLQQLDIARNTGIENKSIGLKPGHNRVLLRLSEQARLADNISAQFIDHDLKALELGTFDVLLVVENLDCFYQLHVFCYDLPYQSPLIIYRGDQLYSQGCKTLKDLWLSTARPCIYFGDFDAKGVSIALHEGYSHMLLPDFATISQLSTPSMLPDKQLSFIAALQQKQVSAAFQPYQSLLCDHFKALRQQRMQALQLQPVSLHFHSKQPTA